jgi:hypothetical protein
MSLTGFHPLRDKLILKNLQAVADLGCHLEGSSPLKGFAYRGVYCSCIPILEGQELGEILQIASGSGSNFLA